MGGRGGAGHGGVEDWSLGRVGRLVSGNNHARYGTVANEYRQKEVLGNYDERSWEAARDAGYAHPRDYQRALTEDIRQRGMINPVRVSQWDEKRNYLSEGYHRYAAARQLGWKTMRVAP